MSRLGFNRLDIEAPLPPLPDPSPPAIGVTAPDQGPQGATPRDASSCLPASAQRYDGDVAEPEPHVLVVAHRTAATPLLLGEVRRRSRAGPCRITLLVPRPYWDPDTEEAELVVELAIPLLEDAAGKRVDPVIGDSDPVEAVRQFIATTRVDEVIVSTLPQRVSHWLRRDVPSRLEALGLPVTVVTAVRSSRSLIT
jgi:hypothetical protein